MDYLDLSESDIISIPTSIKTFVRLRYLILDDCKQLQEIKEFPPNLKVVQARGCISLESLPEMSKEFNFPQLEWINLARCYKVNRGNWISNPAWNGAEMIFPGYKIPDWFSHCKEITSNSKRCEFDIKVAPPYNLDDIIGIAFCAVIESVEGVCLDVHITRASEPFQEVTDVMHYWKRLAECDDNSDNVWLRYLTREDITRPRDVSVDQAGDHLRIIFEKSMRNNFWIFKRCGVHLLYKQHDEQNAKDHENVDVHLDAPIEDIGNLNLANPMDHGSQLSKRRRVDYVIDDQNIRSNLDIGLFMSAKEIYNGYF